MPIDPMEGPGPCADHGLTEDQRDVNGYPVGPPVPTWSPRPTPRREILAGRYSRLEPLDPERHLAEVWQALSADSRGTVWTYLAYGPFASLGDYRNWVTANCLTADPLFFAIVHAGSGNAVGLSSYLRIDPAAGVLEIGHLQFSPQLQRTREATEALYLLLLQAFSLGYRRCEWKCDSLNAASRRAAERLGLRFEGVFRQASIYKGRNRDTAWYSLLDSE
jgi:RimJ/RimL family protein N-acetyltransferase